MKKILKSLLVITLGICCLLSGPKTVRAEEKEEVLFTLREAQDIVVTIAYEVNDVSFTLVSPSGFQVTKDTDTENITVYAGTTSTLVFLGQAEVGEWKIRYDKGSNESIRVSANVQDSSFFITDYQVGSPDDGKISLNFTVSANKVFNYGYQILLTTSRETLNGKELASGRGRIDEVVEKEISLDDVNTYDTYYLLLYVSYDLNGSEIFDYSYSEAFSYTNPDAPEALENLDVTVDHDRKGLDVDWTKYLPGGATSVYLEAYVGEECILSSDYPKEEGCSAWVPFETENPIRLEISYRNRDGVVSELLQKEVDVSNHLDLPETGKVSSDIWTFSYQGMKNTEVVFELEDDEHVIVLDGDGSKYLTLPESRNKIVVSYQDEEGNRHTYQRVANISDMKPVIELLRMVDGVTTEESVIMITGTTNAESLTVNGQSVEVMDGEFAYPYSLSKGENHIELEAVLGESVTKLSAVVTKATAKSSVAWIYLVAGLAVSFLGIAAVTVLEHRRNRVRGENAAAKEAMKETTNTATDEVTRKKPFGGIRVSIALNWGLAALFGVLWLGLILYTNSAAYLKVAYQWLLLAKVLLLLTQAIFWIAVALAVIALLRTLVRIAKAKWSERKQKKEEGKNEKAK